ncbi:MAG: hypothetical protein HY334_01590 [Armatimonadetes bacterium]|nr:hypothetical protein [Armatimonadota bacterium]
MKVMAGAYPLARLSALSGAAILLAALLPGVGGVGRPEPQVVIITLRHSRFLPAHLTVRRGTPVRFVITNVDPIDHEFILGDEAVQRRHETGTEQEHGAVPGEVTVPAGSTRETTYTFTRPGRLLIGCHAPGHYNYGMRGWVRVVD